MAKILAISSYVAHGTVGLQAIGPALSALGHSVIALPSVILSNHPGLGPPARQEIDPSRLAEMMRALDQNGFLNDIAVVLTGYLPTEATVRFAAGAVEMVKTRSPRAKFICDPVFGDDPKGFYLPVETAAAIKVHLVPRADLLTPNRFELSWLASASVEGTDMAVRAARQLGVADVVATSIPVGARTLGTIQIAADEVCLHSSESQARVPNGTGDLLAGLLAGYWAQSYTLQDCVRASHAVLMDVIAASPDCDSLDLSALTRIREHD